MVIHIVNNLSYNNVVLSADNKSHQIAKEENITLSTNTNSSNICITILEKNHHYFDIIDLIGCVFHSKSSWCEIFCITTFMMESNKDECTVILNDLEYKHNERYTYKSISVVSKDAQILDVKYQLSDTSALKKKHIIYNLLVPMVLPLAILNLWVLIRYHTVGIIGWIVHLIFFIIPGFRDIIKFNRTCDEKETLDNLYHGIEDDSLPHITETL